MQKQTNRMSWTDTFQNEAGGTILNKEYLFLLDDILYGLWALGRNVILLCAPHGKAIEVLVVPHYLIADTMLKSTFTAKMRIPSFLGCRIPSFPALGFRRKGTMGER